MRKAGESQSIQCTCSAQKIERNCSGPLLNHGVPARRVRGISRRLVRSHSRWLLLSTASHGQAAARGGVQLKPSDRVVRARHGAFRVSRPSDQATACATGVSRTPTRLVGQPASVAAPTAVCYPAPNSAYYTLTAYHAEGIVV